MSKEKDTVAWECPNCGQRHLWAWAKGEALPSSIVMFCDVCEAGEATRLVPIGRHAWAALFMHRGSR